MGTGSFPGVKNGRGMILTLHPLVVSWSWKGRAIPLLPLWAVRPVQSLSACTRVRFTFFRSYWDILHTVPIFVSASFVSSVSEVCAKAGTTKSQPTCFVQPEITIKQARWSMFSFQQSTL